MYYMYLSQQKGRPFQFRILKSLIILILKVKGSLLNYVATKLNIYGNLDSRLFKLGNFDYSMELLSNLEEDLFIRKK